MVELLLSLPHVSKLYPLSYFLFISSSFCWTVPFHNIFGPPAPPRVQNFPDIEYDELIRQDGFLRERLDSIGLSVLDVPGNGECLFASSSEQTSGEDYVSPEELRRRVCDELDNNRGLYQQFDTPGESNYFDDYDHRVQEMRKKGTYGENEELVAISKVLGRTIHVYLYRFHEGVDDHYILPITHPSLSEEDCRHRPVVKLSRHLDIHYNIVEPKDGIIFRKRTAIVRLSMIRESRITVNEITGNGLESIVRLPDTALSDIFSYLGPNDMIRFSLSNPSSLYGIGCQAANQQIKIITQNYNYLLDQMPHEFHRKSWSACGTYQQVIANLPTYRARFDQVVGDVQLSPSNPCQLVRNCTVREKYSNPGLYTSCPPTRTGGFAVCNRIMSEGTNRIVFDCEEGFKFNQHVGITRPWGYSPRFTSYTDCLSPSPLDDTFVGNTFPVYWRHPHYNAAMFCFVQPNVGRVRQRDRTYPDIVTEETVLVPRSRSGRGERYTKIILELDFSEGANCGKLRLLLDHDGNRKVTLARRLRGPYVWTAMIGKQPSMFGEHPAECTNLAGLRFDGDSERICWARSSRQYVKLEDRYHLPGEKFLFKQSGITISDYTELIAQQERQQEENILPENNNDNVPDIILTLNDGNDPVLNDDNDENDSVVNDENDPVVNDDNEDNDLVLNDDNEDNDPVLNDENNPVVNEDNDPVLNNENNPVVNDDNDPVLNDDDNEHIHNDEEEDTNGFWPEGPVVNEDGDVNDNWIAPWIAAVRRANEDGDQEGELPPVEETREEGEQEPPEGEYV